MSTHSPYANDTEFLDALFDALTLADQELLVLLGAGSITCGEIAPYLDTIDQTLNTLDDDHSANSGDIDDTLLISSLCELKHVIDALVRDVLANAPGSLALGSHLADSVEVLRVHAVTGLDLVGSSLNDVVQGGSLNDLIQGMAGNDLLIGLGGDDCLDGGADSFSDLLEVDTARYAGTRSEYTITRDGHFAQVIDLLGFEGTDTLHAVERLDFSDLNVALDIEGNGGQAYRLYQAAFDRVPDMAGVGYWIYQRDAGESMYNIAWGFLRSDEFKSKYGQSPTNQEYTLALYTNVLHRAPDLAGYDYWNAVLNGDPLLGQTTREQMLIDFSESAENKANVIGVIGNGFDYVEWV